MQKYPLSGRTVDPPSLPLPLPLLAVPAPGRERKDFDARARGREFACEAFLLDPLVPAKKDEEKVTAAVATTDLPAGFFSYNLRAYV